MLRDKTHDGEVANPGPAVGTNAWRLEMPRRMAGYLVISPGGKAVPEILAVQSTIFASPKSTPINLCTVFSSG